MNSAGSVSTASHQGQQRWCITTHLAGSFLHTHDKSQAIGCGFTARLASMPFAGHRSCDLCGARFGLRNDHFWDMCVLFRSFTLRSSQLNSSCLIANKKIQKVIIRVLNHQRKSMNAMCLKDGRRFITSLHAVNCAFIVN